MLFNKNQKRDNVFNKTIIPNEFYSRLLKNIFKLYGKFFKYKKFYSIIIFKKNKESNFMKIQLILSLNGVLK